MLFQLGCFPGKVLKAVAIYFRTGCREPLRGGIAPTPLILKDLSIAIILVLSTELALSATQQKHFL
jgi:hypothetical protein